MSEDTISDETSCTKNDDTQNSVILTFFDQYGINYFIHKISKNTPIKTTKIFRTSLILFIFLAIVFYSVGILKFEFSVQTIVLSLLLLVMLIEIVGANLPILRIFKKYVSNEEKTKRLLQKLDAIDSDELEEEIRFFNFSPSGINLFLEKIENDDGKTARFIAEKIITLNQLSQENLDRIFNPKILGKLRERSVINLLIRFQDRLSVPNIQNVYNFFKNNEKIVKVLFATQIDSEILSVRDDQKSQLSVLYDKLQNKKIYRDFWTNIISIKGAENFRKYLTLTLLAIFCGLTIYNFPNIRLFGSDPFSIAMTAFGYIVIGPMMLTAIIIKVFFDPIYVRCVRRYKGHLLHKIFEVD
jgi:hypothetical protein